MFCRLSGEYIREGFTQIDNAFLLRYLPGADPVDLKVYLYGLALATLNEKAENTLERIALALRLTEQRVSEAFSVWENAGIVSLSKNLPFTVTYLSVKNPAPKKLSYNAKEFAEFNEEVSRLFPDRIAFGNELTAYYDLIKINKIEPNAVLLIMKYCAGLGKTSAPYILTVAENWVKTGLHTEQQVNAHIAKLEANIEAVKLIFSAIGIKREADIDDRQYYDKWTELGYTLDAILTAARSLKKKGGMERLDKFILELKAADAVTSAEIAEYIKTADELRGLSSSVVKALGGFYANIDAVAETYIIPWKAKGFTPAALVKVAGFCFLRGYNTLDGMNQMLTRFHNRALLDEAAITAYVERQISVDENINSIFKKCSHTGLITNRDREFYRVWADEWGFDDECIFTAAESADKNPYPMQRINKGLSKCLNLKAFTPQEIRKILAENAPEPRQKSGYTEEQLKRVLVSIEDLEI